MGDAEVQFRNTVVSVFTMRLHVMQRTVGIAVGILSVRPSVRQMRVL